MGKRELLIVLAFLVVGLVAYQLTAPPPKEGERGFSLTRMFSNLRREIRSESVRVTYTHEGRLAVSAAVAEVRLTPGRSVSMVITGEDRADIAYEMPVESTGPDEATATGSAKRTALQTDDLGSAMAVRISFPPEARQTASLTLRVPSRLTVRVESGARARITGVRAVHLANVPGEITLVEIAGAVSGTHRQGDLVVSGVGSVNLTLQSSRAKFRGIQHGLTLNTRGGECEISTSAGPIDITAMNGETTITAHDGPIQIGGEGGTVRVRAPSRDTKVDMRRAEVELQIAGAAGVTALTTDEPLRVLLDDSPPIEIDASASEGGHVQAADFNLQPTQEDRASRLTHVFGDKKLARVVLRNVRGDIVIGKRK